MIRLMSVWPEVPDDGWTAKTAHNASAECLRLNGEVVAYNHAHHESLARPDRDHDRIPAGRLEPFEEH